MKRIRIGDTGSPLTNGRLARAALAIPEMLVELEEAEYNFGTTPCYPGHKARAVGIGDWLKVHLFNSGFTFSSIACCWELDSNVFANLTVESRVGLGQQSQVIGHHGKYAKPNSVDDLDHVHVIAHSFGPYWWAEPGAGNVARIQDSWIEAGRVGLMCSCGNGPDGQRMDGIGSKFEIDFEKSPSAGGDIGNRPVGIWCRSGTTRIFDVDVDVRGSKDCTLAAGLAMIPGDWPGATLKEFPYDWPFVDTLDFRAKIEPNGTPVFGEIIHQMGTLNGKRVA